MSQPYCLSLSEHINICGCSLNPRWFPRFFTHIAVQVTYSRHHDLLTPHGFLSSFQACRRLVQGGFLWIGIPCASWIWLSRGSTFRCRLRPSGSRRVRKVKLNNRLVRRVLYMFLGGVFYQVACLNSLCSDCRNRSNLEQAFLRLEYLQKKDVQWCIEQPTSSLLPLYKPFKAGV